MLLNITRTRGPDLTETAEAGSIAGTDMSLEVQNQLQLGKSHINVFHVPETEQIPSIKVSAKDGERKDMTDAGL